MKRLFRCVQQQTKVSQPATKVVGALQELCIRVNLKDLAPGPHTDFQHMALLLAIPKPLNLEKSQTSVPQSRNSQKKIKRITGLGVCRGRGRGRNEMHASWLTMVKTDNDKTKA
eukprot:649878-Amphidinium_carterae.1